MDIHVGQRVLLRVKNLPPEFRLRILDFALDHGLEICVRGQNIGPIESYIRPLLLSRQIYHEVVKFFDQLMESCFSSELIFRLPCPSRVNKCGQAFSMMGNSQVAPSLMVSMKAPLVTPDIVYWLHDYVKLAP